ncbi:MAG: hypothetical protein AAF590_05080 [Pseudomonadota bacterium]
MASAHTHMGGFWSAVWPKKLTLGIGVIVSVAVIITEIIFLVPASYVWHQRNIDDAVERVRLAWYHSSDPIGFLSPEHKARLGERMIRDGLIMGGVIYDSSGEPLAVFGERPVFELNIARISSIKRQESPNTAALDVHLSPEDTNLSHHIIVRIPMQPIQTTSLLELRNFGLSVLFIAGVTALLFIIASMFALIRPLRRINNALRQAVRDPDNADGHHVHMTRQDEIGQISKSLNMLLTSVSVVYQDELAAMEKAIDTFNFTILQFDDQDRIIDANRKAIDIFNQPDVNSLRTMNRNCAHPLGAKGSRPRPILELVGDRKEPTLLTLHTDNGFFTALGFGAPVFREDGTYQRRFVALVQMDEFVKDSRQAIIDAQKAQKNEMRVNVELRETRRLMEACLCLLEPGSPNGEGHANDFLPDRILNGWYSEAQKDGLVSGNLEHGLLPAMSGDKKAIRNALRQAMLLTYAHTEAERPVLRVDSIRQSNGNVMMTFSDISHKREDVGGLRSKNVDPTLPLGALKVALKRANGKLMLVSTSRNNVYVKIQFEPVWTSSSTTKTLSARSSMPLAKSA